MPGPDRRRTRPPEFKSFTHNPLALAKARLAASPKLGKPVVKDPGPGASGAPGSGGAVVEPVAVPAPQRDGNGQLYITLAQLLKKLSLAPTGGAAKHAIRKGGITVNETAEDRPGRKLHAGDKVSINGKVITVDLTAESV